MIILNTEIAEKFNELADLLELENANPFRIRAYRNAARLIENLPHEVVDILKQGVELTTFPGIGKDLAEKINTIVATGELPLLSEIKKELPAHLSEMMKIPSLGPKRVKALHEKLGINTISDLKRAAIHKRIAALPGFGEKTQNKILMAFAKFSATEKRMMLALAEKIAEPLLHYLQGPGSSSKVKLKHVIIAGSFRRRKATVGDLDILATAEKVDAHALIDHFVKYPDVTEILAKGPTRAAVTLRNKIQVDLRVEEEESFGAALLYFTGSKDHNVTLRKIAIGKKLKLNEYGLFKGKTMVARKTEQEIYKKLGLKYIEPELRENRGEIEAAKANKLPSLIQLADIKGDLHCHSEESGDAVGSLDEIAFHAKQLGYEYIAVTDHSERLAFVNGLDKKRLIAQIKKIDIFNAKQKNFRVLKSLECDILGDGSLDLPNEILKELDLVVCSVHSKFDLSRQEQTERVLRAMDNPYFTILAHPTGRLIGRREPYAIDLEKIMLEAKARHKFLELNATPDRLDLNDVHCRMAKEIGVKISIASDSHNPENLFNMRFGVDEGRRGWLEPSDVINTLSYKDLLLLIKRN